MMDELRRRVVADQWQASYEELLAHLPEDELVFDDDDDGEAAIRFRPRPGMLVEVVFEGCHYNLDSTHTAWRHRALDNGIEITGWRRRAEIYREVIEVPPDAP